MTPKLEEKEFYKAEEIAEALQVSKMTVYRMLEKGDIPYFQFGKVKRVRKEDFDAFLSKSRRGGGAENQ